MRLRPTSAPQLPVAPQQYSAQERDKYSNALRLYFNQIDSDMGALLGDQGGKYLCFPYAAIQRTTNKTFTINTATQITFDQNDFMNGCTNDGTDGIHVLQSGIYNYQFSVQFSNADNNTIHSAWIWLRKNGEDIAATASKFDIPGKHGTPNGYLIAACNFFVQLTAGDTIEMWAAVDNVNVTMYAAAAQTVPFAMPAIPSVVATLSFVSDLLS